MQLGEGRVYLAYKLKSIVRGNQDKNRDRDHGSVLLTGLLCMHSYATQDHLLGAALSPVVWALPHQSLAKKTPYRLACSQADGDIFLGEVPFPEDSNLCQVNKKPIWDNWPLVNFTQ